MGAFPLSIRNLLFIVWREPVAQSRLRELAFPASERIAMRCAGVCPWAPWGRNGPFHLGVGYWWGSRSRRSSVAHSHPTLCPSHPRCWPGSSFAGRSSPNPINSNSCRRHLRPFSPAVTACHMLYCSSASWEASDCSREPPRSAERTPQLSRCTGGFLPLGAGTGEQGSGLHGSIFVAGKRLLRLGVTFVFLRRATFPALVLSWGAPGCGHVSVPRLAETCLVLQAPGLLGCCVGILQVSQAMPRPLVLAARETARGDVTCLW